MAVISKLLLKVVACLIATLDCAIQIKDSLFTISPSLSTLVELVLNEPAFKKYDLYFLSTEEAFDRSMEKSVRYIQMRKQFGINEPDLKYFHR